MENNKYKVKYGIEYDLVFNRVVGENKDIAIELCNLYLEHIHIDNSDDVTISRGKMIESVKLKTANMDVILSVVNKFDINLEMQRTKPQYDMNKRLLVYLTYMIRKNMRKGNDYDLKECHILCFVGFNMFNDNKFIHTLYMQDDDIRIKEFSITVVQLTNQKYCDKLNLRDWNELLTTNDYTNLVGRCSIMDVTIDQILKANDNKELQEEIEAQEKSDMLEKLIRSEGFKQGKIEMAKSMLEKNFDINLISELTGLSVEEIKKL